MRKSAGKKSKKTENQKKPVPRMLEPVEPWESPHAIRLVPLGGLGEIGMNCLILESHKEILVIDCGILFTDLDHFGVEYIAPDLTYLIQRKEKVKAFIITHGHEDHIGALGLALRAGLNVPIYASGFAALLIESKLRDQRLLKSGQVKAFRLRERFSFETFTIETVPVNHSIVESVAFIIDTPAGKIIHTGDFKIDPSPYYGKPMDLTPFQKAAEEGVLLLMSDSTNIEKRHANCGEGTLYGQLEKVFASAEGLTIITLFASNIGRLGQIFELADKLKKKVALVGRTMENNSTIAQQAGYLKHASGVLVPVDELENYERKDLILVATGSQGEFRSALKRIALGGHQQIQIEKGDLVVFSSKFIPGNEKAIGRVINELFKQGADVIYEAIQEIHVSGHASQPELKQMLETVRPKFFIPVHGEYRHLVHHSNLAKECGVSSQNVLTAVNGDVLELTSDSLRLVQHIEETRVLIETREGADITKTVLKDRRKLAEMGILFVLMVRNTETGRLVSPPQVITRGIAKEERESSLIEETTRIVQRVFRQYEKSFQEGAIQEDIHELIRVEIRRFLFKQFGKKGVVVPIVLDI